jgi:predicted DNA-binding transcriptional regulator AlpA
VFVARPGHLVVYTCTLPYRCDQLSTPVNFFLVPNVRTEDLIDAQEVAHLLGLTHRNAVSAYQRRYADMPRPVVNLGPNRPLLWLRPEIEAWLIGRPSPGKGHPRRPAAL